MWVRDCLLSSKVSAMGRHCLAVLLLMVAIVVVVDGKPQSCPKDDSDDCRITENFHVDNPCDVWFLAYVNRSQSVVLTFIYTKPLKDYKTREAIAVGRLKAVHYLVRHSKTTNQSMDLPQDIPAGWNTFRLRILENTLSVTLVQGEDEVNLLVLTLEHNVTKIYAKGLVAHCSKASPEWTVNEGEEAEVILQLEGSGRYQLLEVTARESAVPYIRFPSSRSNITYLPTNQTLKVTTNVRGNDVLIRLFKTGENGDEEVTRGTAALTHRPLSVGGVSHVRLITQPSCPVTPADQLPSPPVTPADPSSTYFRLDLGSAMLGWVVGMAMCVVGMAMWMVMQRRKKPLNRNEQEINNNMKDEEENTQKALLPKTLSRRQDLEGGTIITLEEERGQMKVQSVTPPDLTHHDQELAAKPNFNPGTSLG